MWPQDNSLLLVLGFVLLVLAYLSLLASLPQFLTRKKPLSYEVKDVAFPPLTIEVATYNEGDAVKRSLLSIPGAGYPLDLLKVMVLDDSDEESSRKVVDLCVRELKSLGVDAVVYRRGTREGGKPGFLKQVEGLITTPYVFIVDADFTLVPGSLSKAVSFAVAGGYSYCQMRWDLEGEGFVADLQKTLLDYHMSNEQEKAFSVGAPVKINGSCVLLKNSDLLEVGGWNAHTITEDLDLTVRFALRGKKGAFWPGLVGVGLATPSFRALFRQVKRWVMGDARALVEHGPSVLKMGNLATSLTAFSYFFNYIPSLFSVFLLASGLIALFLPLTVPFALLLSLPLLAGALSLFRKEYLRLYLISFSYSVFVAFFLLLGMLKRESQFTRTEKRKPADRSAGFGGLPIFFIAVILLAAALWGMATFRVIPALLIFVYSVSFSLVYALWRMSRNVLDFFLYNLSYMAAIISGKSTVMSPSTV